MNYRYDLKKKSILLVGYVPNFEFRHNCFKLHNNLFEKISLCTQTWSHMPLHFGQFSEFNQLHL